MVGEQGLLHVLAPYQTQAIEPTLRPRCRTVRWRLGSDLD